MSGFHTIRPETDFSVSLDQLFESHLTAKANRALFAAANMLTFHLIGNPGSGKTTLLERTLERLSGRAKSVVIEGQMATELDADRIRLNGTPTFAITTENEGQLSADLVARTLKHIKLDEYDLLWIENVGSLVSPTDYSLGTHKNILLVSVADGEELPLKYPSLFRDADLIIMTKVDLLPHLRFDLGQFIDNIEQIQPNVSIMDLSAESGEGMELWIRWLIKEMGEAFEDEVDMTYEKPISVPFIG